MPQHHGMPAQEASAGEIANWYGFCDVIYVFFRSGLRQQSASLAFHNPGILALPYLARLHSMYTGVSSKQPWRENIATFLFL